MKTKRPQSEFGPLPKRDRNAQLEQLSIKALNSILTVDRFLFRDGRTDDSGVDGSLELLFKGLSTNIQAQVQLKAQEIGRPNKDGFVTVDVTTSNLNYLLMGQQSPLYILYIASRDELRFLWAYDEQKRFNQINPAWMDQANIRLKFRRLLTQETLDEIYERVKQEAQLKRKLFDTLNKASLNETVVFSIDSSTLATRDQEEIEKILLNSGTTLVSSGYAANVQNAIGLLRPATARMPRIQLIKAFAEHVLGRYKGALASLDEAQMRYAELSPEDQQFVICLRGLCEYQIGRISLSEFVTRLNNEVRDSSSNGWFVISQRLNMLRYSFIMGRQGDSKAILLKNLAEYVSEISCMEDVAEGLKLHALLILLELQGAEVIAESTKSMLHFRIRVSQGLSSDLQELMEQHQANWLGWEKKILDAANKAKSINHPVLLAHALAIRLFIRIVGIVNYQVFNILRGLPPEDLPKPILSQLRADAEQAEKIYKQAGDLEGELRVKMLLAEISALDGDEENAKEMALDVLSKAQVMDYASIRVLAETHIEKGPIQKAQLAIFERGLNDDLDFEHASANDDTFKKYAREHVRAMNLPIERLPVIERAYQLQRDICRERIDWCRHVELFEDLDHTTKLSTYYQTDPNRYGYCTKHGHKSAIGNPHWPVVISAFKGAYCAECGDRSPKLDTSEKK